MLTQQLSDNWRVWPLAAKLRMLEKLQATDTQAKPKHDYPLRLRTPHAEQQRFIDSTAKRKVIRAGRRGGKTVGVAIPAIRAFQAGRRVLYAAPTQDQIEAFWFEVVRALQAGIDAHALYKNETEHVIEVARTKNRIRAKTAWDANTLRGDYADLLILDEWQLMNESAWERVGAPMLLDNDGDAVFIYTPPSVATRETSKARDKLHAAKMFKAAQADTSGRWAAFSFPSEANPHISKAALADISRDMTSLAYRQEILAEDVEDNPSALWNRADIEVNRVTYAPEMFRVIVGVDPTATATGDEAGIVVDGATQLLDAMHLYTLADVSCHGSPQVWATAAVNAYHNWKADAIVAEANNGGEMVSAVIHQVDDTVPVKLVHASRGKATRAEPIAAIYEQGRAHHVGLFATLEDEMCLWSPGMDSPNRMDAHVWAATELMLGLSNELTIGANPLAGYRG